MHNQERNSVECMTRIMEYCTNVATGETQIRTGSNKVGSKIIVKWLMQDQNITGCKSFLPEGNLMINIDLKIRNRLLKASVAQHFTELGAG